MAVYGGEREKVVAGNLTRASRVNSESNDHYTNGAGLCMDVSIDVHGLCNI